MWSWNLSYCLQAPYICCLLSVLLFFLDRHIQNRYIRCREQVMHGAWVDLLAYRVQPTIIYLRILFRCFSCTMRLGRFWYCIFLIPFIVEWLQHIVLLYFTLKPKIWDQHPVLRLWQQFEIITKWTWCFTKS